MCRVRGQQFPITSAYAFTDYHSQGQMITHVIVDIVKPPTAGGLNLFNLYITPSRSWGQESMQLLKRL
ncbi:hypothetical protein EDD15DRAFT_2168359 [Pisolithus albus]|nr:hypothetical protein EDD15DRAFT_2168359 [Pisolithus albus]